MAPTARRDRRGWSSVVALLAAVILAADVATIALSAAPAPSAAPVVVDEVVGDADPVPATGSTADGWAERPRDSEDAVDDVAERPVADASATERAEERPDPPSAERRVETIDDRGAAALARIDYPWEQLGFEIRFRPPRRGVRGMTFPEERRIELYVRLGDPVARTVHDLAHEIGHAVDVVHMTGERRSQWAERRGFDRSVEWWPCSRCEDRGTGSGDYAEVFALWQVGGRYFSSQVASAPTTEELAELVPYFRSAPDEDDRRRDDDDGDDGDPLVPCMVSCRP